MFNTKDLVHNVNAIPVTWIFEHFCKLKEKLTGQDVKIKSMFNLKERTPSMCIYTDGYNTYKYKDFSTGKGGSAIDMVKDLSQLPFHKTCQLIVETYNDFVLHNNGGYDIEKFQKASKYKVTSHKFRSWSTQDQYFWTKFNIGSKILDAHNVKPLESYCMTKDEDELCIKGLYLYGYFKDDGTLYKIYQPKTLDKKFIKVTGYIQGMHQCTGNKNLLIISSLKDVMSVKSLGINLDVIAPDSENTMIKQDMMEELRDKYNKIIVMFDFDEAGIESMKKYKEKYPFIEITVLPMSKDVSDSIKDYGAKEVRNRLVPILDKKLQDGKEDSGKIKNTKNKECRDNDRSSLLEFY
jgi:5S rRNA maturation endonuclease (ribonuclease M5)